MRIAFLILFSLIAFSCSTTTKYNTEGKPENNIPAYLDSISADMQSFAKEADTIYSELLHEDSYLLYVAGKFIDGKDIYAVYFSEKDTLLNFYRFDKKNWELVGSERFCLDEVFYITFTDMDNDGRNEIITSSHPNMNGNTWQDVFYCSKKDKKINYAGHFTTAYTINKESKTVETDYGGSWYMPLTRTLYRWYDEKLVAEKQMILELEKADMIHDNQLLSYYENPTLGGEIIADSLSLIYKIPYDKKKHETRWENFFNENQVKNKR